MKFTISGERIPINAYTFVLSKTKQSYIFNENTFYVNKDFLLFLSTTGY